ncbi:ATP-binding cassette domain-containing protein [Staphylococcus croceilyticus]|uniref:ATP-binding cassette domain-containing protein n=1 Tax=Staphylococcus croceilyticus TaxID=319942 RepID=A0ABY2KG66_9STAP|nr:ATP-binding cassette domain-containing protein [Staphylococcus croceilyticus]PNZ69498.1 NAD+ synthetase [Staphylococcus croceilyticus]TGA81026.1 ATP-binding cassette domain-containing protein [Staphylococcus croceilyticus]
MLQIKQLNKSFSDKTIFKNFNYEANSHENIIISGVSGSGKSTLAQIIAGLDDNYQGVISYNDLTLGKVSRHEWMKHIQYIPQYNSNTLDPKKTVEWILKQPLKNFHIPEHLHEEKMQNAMKLCKLDSQLLNKKVSNLSGGQFQRLWIAKALLVEPDVIILDEATTNLDVINEELILQTLREIENLQLIIITHDPYLLHSLPGKHLKIGSD